MALLELGGDHAVGLADGGGEGHQRGGARQVLKGAGHTVLAADGGDAQAHLGVQRAQQGSQGLAPALGLVAQALEIFLEGQVHILIAEAGSHQFGDAVHHRQHGPLVGVGAHQVGVEAPGHARAGGGSRRPPAALPPWPSGGSAGGCRRRASGRCLRRWWSRTARSGPSCCRCSNRPPCSSSFRQRCCRPTGAARPTPFRCGPSGAFPRRWS